MNGICYRFPAGPLLAVVDSSCATPTLAIFTDPDALANDESGRRALLIIFAHEIIGYMPRIMCSPTGERGHHDSVVSKRSPSLWGCSSGCGVSFSIDLYKTDRFNTHAS